MCIAIVFTYFDFFRIWRLGKWAFSSKNKNTLNISNYTSIDSVFCSDSEYDSYITYKLSSYWKNHEFRAEFRFFRLISRKNEFSPRESESFLNQCILLFTFEWRFEWCIIVGDTIWKKRLDAFAITRCQSVYQRT